MEIQHRSDGKNGAFYIEENGKHIAEMSYVFAGETRFIIDHTEVGPEGKGRNLGRQLVRAAVDFARERGLSILPLCPFAKKVFDTTPEYSDVLLNSSQKIS